jgi:5-methylcytosine-specific restriction endonuclease McrA
MPRGPKTVKLPSASDAALLVKKMRGAADSNANYRGKSLRIHGAVCARCGREFDGVTLHQLTVHHRDGNHDNNPPDGSNWENLCNHCHDDVHARELLGEYLSRS